MSCKIFLLHVTASPSLIHLGQVRQRWKSSLPNSLCSCSFNYLHFCKASRQPSPYVEIHTHSINSCMTFLRLLANHSKDWPKSGALDVNLGAPQTQENRDQSELHCPYGHEQERHTDSFGLIPNKVGALFVIYCTVSLTYL